MSMGLFGIFETKTEKELDALIARIEMNMSNNYKDAAQTDLRNFLAAFEKYREQGALKGKVLKKYEDKAKYYQEKMQGYTHKDQKPFWT